MEVEGGGCGVVAPLAQKKHLCHDEKRMPMTRLSAKDKVVDKI